MKDDHVTPAKLAVVALASILGFSAFGQIRTEWSQPVNLAALNSSAADA